jgi:aquaporin NIP
VLSFFLMFVVMAVATDTRAVDEAAAIAIGGAIALDALLGGPISDASMNPARSFGPALISGDLHTIWLYVLAPPIATALGALAASAAQRDQIDPRAAPQSARTPEHLSVG